MVLFIVRSKVFFDLFCNFFLQFGIVGKQLLDCFSSLSEFGLSIAEPRTAFLDYACIDAYIDQLSHLADALTEQQIELYLTKRRCNFVFHYLDSYSVSDICFSVFDSLYSSYVQTY